MGTLSPQLISRLKKRREQEHAEWSARPLGDMRIVYVWADAVYFRVRGAAESVCMLVVVGADDQGKKHFLAIEPDTREGTVQIFVFCPGETIPTYATGPEKESDGSCQ